MQILIGFLLLIGIKVFSLTEIGKIFSYAFLLYFIVQILIHKKIIFPKTLFNLLLWFTTILIIISIIKQFIYTSISVVPVINMLSIFGGMFWIIYVNINKKHSIKYYIKQLYNIVNFYVIFNFIFFLIGIQRTSFGILRSNNAGINEFLNLLGIQIQRVLFIFAPNLAYFATVSGVLFILALFLYIDTHRLKYFLSLIYSITSIILVDSRGALFGLILILIMIIIFRKFWLKYQLILLIVFFFSAFIFTHLLTFIVDELGINFMARGEYILSKRELIWINFNRYYQPNIFQFFFGYGNTGQYISGISNYYSFLFKNWINPTQISLHNNSYQLLVDIGFIGVILWFTIFFVLIKKSIKSYLLNKETSYLAFPAIINYILIVGYTDITTNLANISIYFIIFYILIATNNSNWKQV